MAGTRKGCGTMARQTSRKIDGIPVFLTFVVMFGVIAAVWMTVKHNHTVQPTVEPVSAFDVGSEDELTFVEVTGNKGQRYYVITKNASSTTTAAPRKTETTAETETTQKTKAIQKTESTKKTDTTQKTETTATTERTQTDATTTTTTQSPEEKQRKVAYLTFDDGPSENTGKILDILDEYNVKATFFVIYHKNMESAYRDIVARGHTIALHTYSHSYRKIYKSEDAYFSDLQKIHDFVQETTGVDSRIMRFPGGSSNTISRKYNKGIMKKLKKSVVEKGYIYHDWNVDSTDAAGVNRPVETLLKNVKKDLTSHRKSDILMHDTGSSKQTTVDALPAIIEYIRSEGYEMEALTEDSPVIRHSW